MLRPYLKNSLAPSLRDLLQPGSQPDAVDNGWMLFQDFGNSRTGEVTPGFPIYGAGDYEQSDDGTNNTIGPGASWAFATIAAADLVIGTQYELRFTFSSYEETNEFLPGAVVEPGFFYADTDEPGPGRVVNTAEPAGTATEFLPNPATLIATVEDAAVVLNPAFVGGVLAWNYYQPTAPEDPAYEAAVSAVFQVHIRPVP